MKNSLKLWEVLSSYGTEEIDIKVLNEYFTPLHLASQIISLENAGLINVNWKTKKINFGQLNLKSLIVNKRDIVKSKREKPKFMRSEELEINKPYLKINERED